MGAAALGRKLRRGLGDSGRRSGPGRGVSFYQCSASAERKLSVSSAFVKLPQNDPSTTGRHATSRCRNTTKGTCRPSLGTLRAPLVKRGVARKTTITNPLFFIIDSKVFFNLFFASITNSFCHVIAFCFLSHVFSTFTNHNARNNIHRDSETSICLSFYHICYIVSVSATTISLPRLVPAHTCSRPIVGVL